MNKYLPFYEQIIKKSIDSLLEIQVAIDVILPHFRAHLKEQVDHARCWPKHNLSVFIHITTGHSVSLRPKLEHLTASIVVVNFFVEVYYGICDAVFQPPHITTSQILVFEKQLNRIQTNCILVNLFNDNLAEVAQIEIGCDRLFNADSWHIVFW